MVTYIIVFKSFIDDLGWYDTAVYNPSAPTPSIKNLCEEGMRLDHHYVFRYCRFAFNHLRARATTRTRAHIMQINEMTLV